MKDLKSIKVPEKILEAVGGSEILAQILVRRGISEDDVLQFLNPDLYTPTAPEELPGIEDALKILRRAIEQGKKICIYGDYDVDGVTATALLFKVLKNLGAKVSYKVPDRFKEGYGMKEEVIARLHDEGVELILTCDCGISNVKEIELAKGFGMEVLVTDHHALPPVLPKADVIVNPQFLAPDHPARGLPGVGVAYFLAKALLKCYGRSDEADGFLDLVTLGIISDVVVLRGENRYLAQKGIPLIKEGRNPGIKALIEVAGIAPEEITEEDIGFRISPRINAAGRMQHAGIAVELFLTEDAKKAEELAKRLDELNEERRRVGDAMLEEAEALLKDSEGGPILLFKPHWHQGIIGITAGRLCEKYRVPAILMTLKEDGETVVGSARSIEGVNIFEVLQECRDYLVGFGGHAGAAGISLRLDNLDTFVGACSKAIERRMAEVKSAHDSFDLEYPIEKVDETLYYELRKLAPFGEGWPEPVFYCPNVEVITARPTTGQQHYRLVVGHGDKNLSALWWWAEGTPERGTVDLLYSVGINRWDGKEEVQLIIKGILKAEEKEEAAKEERREPRWIDYRSWRELGKPAPIYEDALYFYEGPPLKDFLQKTVDRYKVKEARRLVLLSCPPEPRVLEEIVALSQAEEIILAFSPAEIADIKKVLGWMMKYIKFVVNKQKGHTSVQDLAAVTGQTELVVAEMLRFLEENRLLEVKMEEYGRMHLKINATERVSNVRPPRPLLELFEETRAYRRYMNKCQI